MYSILLSTPRPSAAQKRTLWDDVKKTAVSANSISRVVHANSHRHWAPSEDVALVNRFTVIVGEVSGRGRPFDRASRAQRKQIIETLALEFHRSPMAIRIRLRDAGLLASRPTVASTVSVTTSAPVDPTLAALTAAMNQANANRSEAVATSQVEVAAHVEASAPHSFNNSTFRSMYSA